MVFEPQTVLDQLRDHRRYATELGVTESVTRSGVSHELAARVTQAFGDDDGAVAVLGDAGLDAADEAVLVESHFGEQDQVWRIPRGRCALGRRRRRSNPRGAPSPRVRRSWVEVAAIDATSKPASRIDTATYFATEPKPGQLSVNGRSLSTVLGIPIQASA